MASTTLVLNLFLALVGVIGVSVAFLAVHTLGRRQQEAGYYFAGALIVYTVQKLFALLGHSSLPVQIAFEVGVVASIIYGLLKLYDPDAF